MSDTIYQVEGVKEIPHPDRMESSYEVQEVYFTKFAGGLSRGRSLQITINSEHVQLNQFQVEELLRILQEYW